MAACVLPHIKALPPRPDVTHPTSALYGVAKRMAFKPKTPDRKMMRQFRLFVRKWLRDNLEPLDPTEEFDFEEWLSGSNYSDARKEELRKVHSKIVADDLIGSDGLNINAKVKYFVKEEWYPEYKHFRGIWSREDAFKCISGPFFAKIEKVLFKLPYFIKKIPKDQRADYIFEHIYSPGYFYESTDFTSYESHFTTNLMYNCERELYAHMMSRNLKGKRLLRIIFHVIANFNYVINRFFTLAVDAKRMSGEMNTSLGNGFTNLMFILFACWYYKIHYRGPVVEGDDGLTALARAIPDEYYDKMGLSVKMETSEELSYASFCGMIFDPHERINITDPRKPLSTIMWVPRKYACSSRTKILGLVKSKALSLCFEYPGCPILSVLGMKLFTLLCDVEMVEIGESNYERKCFSEILVRLGTQGMPTKPIGPRTRVLMEKKFGISVQRQRLIEEDILSMTLDDWKTHNALSIMPELWISNYGRYAVDRKFNLRNVRDFRTPGTVNKYLDELHDLRNEGPIKHNVGKKLTFEKFRNHSKYYAMSKLEVFEHYKEYVMSYFNNFIIHMKCLAPIRFGKQ